MVKNDFVNTYDQIPAKAFSLRTSCSVSSQTWQLAESGN